MPQLENETVQQYNARRMRETVKRRKAQGLTQMTNIWVPDDAELRAAIRRAAKRVVQKFHKENPNWQPPKKTKRKS